MDEGELVEYRVTLDADNVPGTMGALREAFQRGLLHMRCEECDRMGTCKIFWVEDGGIRPVVDKVVCRECGHQV